MTLVYILNTYDEYGPEEIRATTDDVAVVAIFDVLAQQERERLDAGVWREGYKESRLQDLTEERSKLVAFIKKHVAGSERISDGWGGHQIHAVELE